MLCVFSDNTWDISVTFAKYPSQVDWQTFVTQDVYCLLVELLRHEHITTGKSVLCLLRKLLLIYNPCKYWHKNYKNHWGAQVEDMHSQMSDYNCTSLSWTYFLFHLVLDKIKYHSLNKWKRKFHIHTHVCCFAFRAITVQKNITGSAQTNNSYNTAHGPAWIRRVSTLI